MSETVTDFRCLTNAALCAFAFAAATGIAIHPDWIDRPIARAVNSLTAGEPLLTGAGAALVAPTVDGAIMVSLLWGAWFAVAEPSPRARLIAGVCAAIVAAGVAHVVKGALPPVPKPLFDPLLGFRVPDVMLGEFNALKNTATARNPEFPSERATLFAGLAVSILLVHRDIGWLATGWLLITAAARLSLGMHYPAGTLASFALAGAFVWLAQLRGGVALAGYAVSWERLSPPTFYPVAFLLSFQIATTFQDLRDLPGRLLR